MDLRRCHACVSEEIGAFCFLGHPSLTTTEIYLKANPEAKRKYIEQASAKVLGGKEDYTEEQKPVALSPTASASPSKPSTSVRSLREQLATLSKVFVA